jgi:hypothetical protein
VDSHVENDIAPDGTPDQDWTLQIEPFPEIPQNLPVFMDRLDRPPLVQQRAPMPRQIRRHNPVAAHPKIRQEMTPLEAAHSGGMHAQDVPAFARPNFIEEKPMASNVTVAAENFKRSSLVLHVSCS